MGGPARTCHPEHGSNYTGKKRGVAPAATSLELDAVRLMPQRQKALELQPGHASTPNLRVLLELRELSDQPLHQVNPGLSPRRKGHPSGRSATH